MRRYQVNGMSCAACVAAVERAVKKVPGVESVAVSLLLGSMTVEGAAQDMRRFPAGRRTAPRRLRRQM